jgi:N6-adenosine-specific RNA methylase IME4
MELPNKKYSIIYADPPWQYKRNGNHSAESVYDVMSIDQIKKLPIQQISEDQAHLYLWTTNSFIQEGLDVCKAWGFEYKTLLTWLKTYKGEHQLWVWVTTLEGVLNILFLV